MELRNQFEVEQKLLLALLGSRKDVLDDAGLLPLLHQVNWRNFLANTYRDLYPYLAFRLEPYLQYMENPSELEPLFNARRLTAVHNLRLRHELGKAIDVLRQSGIPALALKGIVLAHTIYPDPSLRPMSDLDLLIPPGRREEAIGVLQRAGFEFPDLALASHRDLCPRLAPGQEYALPLQLRGITVFLEVHSQLECSEPILPEPVGEFWSRSVSVDLRGLTVRSLCPEDLLFHLCLHQSRWHRFEKGLLPLVDLRLLLDSHADWDWANIAARSLWCRCATWMYLTLEAARDLIGASVPDVFFEALPSPGDLPTLRGLVEKQIWSAQCGRPVPPLFPTLLAEHSWWGRARIVLNRMRLVAGGELRPPSTLVDIIDWTRLFCRRMQATLKTRIPSYLHAWRNGQLKIGALRRAARLLRESNTLFELVEGKSSASRTSAKVGKVV